MFVQSLSEITNALVTFGKTIRTEELFPTDSAEAGKFVINDPYAFCIATCLDRGMKAKIIWSIPFDIYTKLGHLDPIIIYRMTHPSLESLFKNLPHRPRYINAAPRTLQELTKIVVEEYQGVASKIWEGKNASEVKRTFQSIYGVGPGISSMALLLIEKAFPIIFQDRHNMDIKADTHTKRVLYRLGASNAETEEAAIEATRRMNPEWPGMVDGALWYTGQNWCFPTHPNCQECPIRSVCIKRY